MAAYIWKEEILHRWESKPSKRKTHKNEWRGKKGGDFPLAGLGFCWGLIYIRKKEVLGRDDSLIVFVGKKENWWFIGFRRILEKNDSRKPRDYNRDWLGMLLVTLWTLTYIQFLLLVVAKYSIFCWLLWMERATNCCVEISSLSVCYVLHSVNAIDFIWK